MGLIIARFSSGLIIMISSKRKKLTQTMAKDNWSK